MKQLVTIIAFFVFVNINAQEKDKNGILLTAPKAVNQYAFRIGEWDSTSKDLLALNKWKTNSGKHRFYVDENGLTFIEEGLNEKGEIIHKIIYDYIESTDSWENNYTEIVTGKKVKYTSKLVNGKMTESIKNEGSIDSTKYTIVAPNVFIYTSVRTYGNGFKIVTHVSVSTKEIASI
ncbi:hypothetical protein [Yeosuana marina]|uniref:hypothetical protein n=1 Tax=Yeosuana marina TaxID=1565536 RepID=UPI0030EF8494